MLETSWAELKKEKFTQMKTVLQHPPIEVAGDLFCEAQVMFCGYETWLTSHQQFSILGELSFKSKYNMIIIKKKKKL